ncbi:ABC transporter ATP-binding protein [Oceanobacillus oncorhynchi subsp. incaldanensis]|uniref:ABC transporter ATP-binding protein n=1 Tax=Oceanobacillus oncorhynchi TaxID=545501 RepID=UPI001B27EF61|nr:ATP-binding cassette domain-containing protein [Oceanobacillus oncorhynchi]GIO19707.1 ABC transporter ATP-binding protein [Oceanobacillus oncorhynchi subsp. incaldanensis]
MIEMKHLTKTFKGNISVNQLSLVIQPGVVTGFLGPNGAGKSTTMKMILGLMNPSGGSVTIDGKAYKDLKLPISKVGALIHGDAVNPKLTARQHLEIIASASGISKKRINSMLMETGLENVKDKPIGTFSLGMKQRLGIAAALLGDPETVILDEPFNGLDVDGIHWLRQLAKRLAREGKAVLVSSHLMSEMQMIADRMIILAQGKLIADMTIDELAENSLGSFVKVSCEDNHTLQRLLAAKGAEVKQVKNDALQVYQLDIKQIGLTAKEGQLALYELTKVQPSLEQLFVELTEGKADYVSIDNLMAEGRKSE